jgi:hypothetical protein
MLREIYSTEKRKEPTFSNPSHGNSILKGRSHQIGFQYCGKMDRSKSTKGTRLVLTIFSGLSGFKLKGLSLQMDLALDDMKNQF